MGCRSRRSASDGFGFGVAAVARAGELPEMRVMGQSLPATGPRAIAQAAPPRSIS